MRLRSLAGVVALGVSVLGEAGSAAAGEATDALRAFFAEGRRIIMAAIERQDPEAGIAAARQLIHRAFDVRQAASRVLGREWDLRTPAEQDEFVRLFADVMERAYLSHVIARLNSEDAIRVNYLDETVTADTAVVETTVESRAGSIPFQYRMARAENRWAVRDVAVDGVSIVESYRAQFARVLRRSSYAETMAALRERYTPGAIAAGEAGSSPPQIAEAFEHPRGVAASATPASTAVAFERAIALERVWVETRPADPERVTPSGARAAVTAAKRATTTVIAPIRLTTATAQAVATQRKAGPAYWVQIGAFRDEITASRVIAQLGSAAVTIATAADSLLRLRLGPFSDRAAATATLRSLKDRGFQPFVVESR